MSGKESDTLESSLVCGQEALNSQASVSGDVAIKPEKRKKKFVASLKSNIRQLGSSVGLKMSNQPKQGSFTDSTQSSDLKKKKSKKQKQDAEERPSQSVDDRRVTLNPKKSKLSASLVKRQSVDKPSVEPFTDISTRSTPPLTPESDWKSTSSSEISFDNSAQASTSKDLDQPPLSTTTGINTTKPLEDLKQQSEGSTSQSPDAEFIEVESENSSKPYSVKNENSDTSTISKELRKESDKVGFESSKESEQLEQILESKNRDSSQAENVNEMKVKQNQDKLNIVKDETEKNDEEKKISHVKQDEKIIIVSSKPEVDLKEEDNKEDEDREKKLMAQHGERNIENPSEKLRQKSFIESERETSDKSDINARGFNDKENEISTQDVNKNKNKESLLQDIENDTTNNKPTEKENNDDVKHNKASGSTKEKPELKSLSKEDEETRQENEPNDTDKHADSDDPLRTKNGATDSSALTPAAGLSENFKGSADYNTFPSQSPLDEQKPSSSKNTSTNMTQISDRRECLYKILVIGELGTGKTSIIKRYVHQFFSQHYRATIGVDFALKVLNWDPNTIIRLQLWDIAGQERFGNMTRVYYKEAVGAFIVFDVTRSATFDAVLKWKQDLDTKVQLADGATIPCVLLANKCDQQKEGIVNSHARMDEYCKEHNFSGWFETSAKENINIDEAAKSLVNQILQNDKVSQNGRDSQDASKFPLEGKGDHQGNKSCPC